MAGQARTPSPALSALHRALEAEPWRFGFFRALRLLECLHRDRPRIGESLRPADDPVRFGQRPHVIFAPSSLAGLVPARGESPPRLEVYLFGLFGPNGPLPLHLTEYARERERSFGDPTFARFADVFHHRMLGLFYRAWASAEPTVSHDRPEDDRFAIWLGTLFGIGAPALRDRDAMPDQAKLHFAGRLSAQPRNAEGLGAILAALLRLPVAIEELVGHWMELPENALCRLGESEDTGLLGESVMVGERVWDCQQKFRLVFGPLDLAQYERLLPGGDGLERLVATVRNYLGDELQWDLNLILQRDEVPALHLGTSGRLGWTTWIGNRPVPEDADDLTLEPLLHASGARATGSATSRR
jgi:type VI secretion system protein ImpH